MSVTSSYSPLGRIAYWPLEKLGFESLGPEEGHASQLKACWLTLRHPATRLIWLLTSSRNGYYDELDVDGDIHGSRSLSSNYYPGFESLESFGQI